MDTKLDKQFKQIMQKYDENVKKRSLSIKPFIYKKVKKRKHISQTPKQKNNFKKLQFPQDFIENKNRQVTNNKLIKNNEVFLSPVHSKRRQKINNNENTNLEKYPFASNNILNDESLYNSTSRKIYIYSLCNNIEKNRTHIFDQKELNEKYKFNIENVEQKKSQKVKMTKNAILNYLYQKYSAISPRTTTYYKPKLNLNNSPETNEKNLFLDKNLRTNYNKKINICNDFYDVNKKIMGNNSKIYINCLLSNNRISIKKILPDHIYKTSENFKEDIPHKKINNLDKIINDIYILKNK